MTGAAAAETGVDSGCGLDSTPRPYRLSNRAQGVAGVNRNGRGELANLDQIAATRSEDGAKLDCERT